MSSAQVQSGETYGFSAEIAKLLSIFINSLYRDQEVFLRELLSNASDASDKLRFTVLQSGEGYDTIKDLKVEIIPDKNNKTLTIRDYGIGMTKNDLINNLGTIAGSGTLKFLREHQGKEDVNTLIGQFGVGFYASFLVASRVEVVSKHAQDVQYRWESTADGTFQIREDDSEPLGNGTKVVLHLKDDQSQYLEERTLKDTFNRHSNFLSYPVYLWTEKTREVEVEDDEASEKPAEEEQEKKEETTDPAVIDFKEDEKESGKKKKKVKEVYHEFEHLNKVKAIWTMNPKEVSHQQYAELYKHLSKDWEEHRAVKHFSVEGNMSFSAILFIPKRMPFDLFEKKQKSCPVKLFVNHVFITDDVPELLPDYMYFVRGVVDSPELPLNISRQCLQESKLVKMIRKSLVKKNLELVSEIAKNDEEYKEFYKSFSRCIKLGVHEDSTNRQKLAGFLMFHSSLTGPDTMVSLGDYVKRMKENQKDIYIVTAESYNAAHRSPFVEAARERKFEVLYWCEPIDEYLVNVLKEFDGKTITCLTKEGVEFPVTDEEKKEREDKEKKFEAFCKHVADVLGSKVDKVKVSWRMTESAFCVVTSQYGWSANMERIMKAQALRDSSQMGYMVGKKHLEVNIEHPVVKELATKHDSDPNAVVVRDVIQLLFETSLISAGFSLEDPNVYASRINRMVELGLGLECSTVIPDSTITPIIDDKPKDSDDDLGSDSDMDRMEEVD